MRCWIFALLATALAGCATLSSGQHGLDRSPLLSDLRYRFALDNLALVADNPAALPFPSALLDRATEGGQPGAENWALDPVAAPERLEALRCACQWALFGPERLRPECLPLLAAATESRTPGRHFGILDRLEKLPRRWVHVGRRAEVPADACGVAHWHGTYVWVTADDLPSLSDFAVILEQVDRVDINAPSLFCQPRLTVTRQQAAERPALRDGQSGKVVTVTRLTLTTDVQGYPIVPTRPTRVESIGPASGPRHQAAVGRRRGLFQPTEAETDYRAQQVLAYFAQVAANPEALPVHALPAEATADVVVGQGPHGTAQLNPLIESAKIRAIHAAFLWALYGPPGSEESAAGLRKFRVTEALAQLPAGWLHIGRSGDVPAKACCSAHHGATCVWVSADGLQALADFTLILQDIATALVPWAEEEPTGDRVVDQYFVPAGGDKLTLTHVQMTGHVLRLPDGSYDVRPEGSPGPNALVRTAGALNTEGR